MKKKKYTKKSIHKIKAQEKKYTYLYVLFFMILFIIIGYYTLSFKDFVDIDDFKTSAESMYYVADTSQIVTLTDSNIIADHKAVKNSPYIINISNYSKEMINYKVVFEEDDYLIKKCGCGDKKIDKKYIRYSIDSKNIFKLNDNMQFIEGTLDKKQNKMISIKLWLDENTPKDIDGHLHGHFVVIK